MTGGMVGCDGICNSCGMGEEDEADEENDEPEGTYGAESAAETPPRTAALEGGGGGGGGWPKPIGWPCAGWLCGGGGG